jgi:hypothetical protein
MKLFKLGLTPCEKLHSHLAKSKVTGLGEDGVVPFLMHHKGTWPAPQTDPQDKATTEKHNKFIDHSFT